MLLRAVLERALVPSWYPLSTFFTSASERIVGLGTGGFPALRSTVPGRQAALLVEYLGPGEGEGLLRSHLRVAVGSHVGLVTFRW